MGPEFVVIPELVALVAEHLGPRELLKCIQLNKAWNDTFVPILWRSIDDSTQSWPSILEAISDTNALVPLPMTKDCAAQVLSSTPELMTKTPPSNPTKDREWLISVFRKYGRQTQHLKAQFPLFLEIACSSGAFTKLNSLVMDWRFHAYGPDNPRNPHPFVGSCPILGTIAAAVNDGTIALPGPYSHSCSELSEPLYAGHLTRDDCTPAQVFLGFVESSSTDNGVSFDQSLLHISTTGSSPWDTVTSPTQENPSLLPTPLGGHSLKELYAEVDSWGTWLQLFPHRTKWEAGCILTDEMVSLFERYCPNLESFKKGIKLWYLDDSKRPPHDPTNRLLATFPNLREFNSIEQYIKVDDMLRQPWICMGLERLVCRIVGVDRLTPEEEIVASRILKPGYSATLSAEENSIIQKFNRCRAQHHGVYNALARLTRLKHLDFGYENRYPWEFEGGMYYTGDDGEEYLYYDDPIFDTLELSLESGLGRLATLKDLEMFGFECLNHKIGTAELDWMAKSWPKLKLMYGLDRERLMDIEHCKKRVALKEYFQKIRPDVVHDSLFYDDI
ncbi:hypothetical protein BGW42_003467 [Actinomortierella wolfii]|nr:hypothetical protein BGW42_003467 [Actinomortierella wolfii]